MKYVKLFLDGHVLGAVDFEQLPFYHLNCGLSEYRKKLNELDNKIDDLTGSGRSSELDECKKERCDVKKAIHEIEKTILRTSIEIFSRENDGTHINRRTRTARELFEVCIRMPANISAKHIRLFTLRRGGIRGSTAIWRRALYIITPWLLIEPARSNSPRTNYQL